MGTAATEVLVVGFVIALITAIVEAV